MARAWTGALMRAVREAEAAGLDVDEIADLTGHDAAEISRALDLRRIPLGHAVDRLNGVGEGAADLGLPVPSARPAPPAREHAPGDWQLPAGGDERLVRACLAQGGFPRAAATDAGPIWVNLRGAPWAFGQAVRP